MLYVTRIEKDGTPIVSICQSPYINTITKINCFIYNDNTNETSIMDIHDLAFVEKKIHGTFRDNKNNFHVFLCEPKHLELMNHLKLQSPKCTGVSQFYLPDVFNAINPRVEKYYIRKGVIKAIGHSAYYHIGYVLYMCLLSPNNTLSIKIIDDCIYLRVFKEVRNKHESSKAYVFKCKPSFKTYYSKLSLGLV